VNHQVFERILHFWVKQKYICLSVIHEILVVHSMCNNTLNSYTLRESGRDTILNHNVFSLQLLHYCTPIGDSGDNCRLLHHHPLQPTTTTTTAYCSRSCSTTSCSWEDEWYCALERVVHGASMILYCTCSIDLQDCITNINQTLESYIEPCVTCCYVL
jgi:hypothetical protein